MAATDMRVLAIPRVSRGSSPEKSRLPLSATPRLVLPNSLGSRSMRCLLALIRSFSRMRLSTSAFGSTGAEASTRLPPETSSPQTPLPSRGASSCASSVMRLPPDTTWKGTISDCRVLSQSKLISARSIGTRTSGSSRSTMTPFSTAIRPSSMWGMPSGPTSARMRPVSGRSISYLIIAPSHGEHGVLGRDFLRLDVDDAVAVCTRRHRRAHAPRPFDGLRAERNRDAATFGSRHAQVDIGERPLLAVALIVDGEVAVLQADLGEVAAVETAGVETLDPSEQRGQIGNAVAHGRARVRGWRGRGGRSVWRGAFGLRRRRRGADGRQRCRSGDQRALVAAGKDRDLAVGLDAHRHLGADQAQPLGADAAGEQARAGNADFRLGRARHDGAVRVAHHDVANAQRRASLVGVALELGAADFNLVAGSEIFFDRRGQPGCGDIEFDRAAGQAPPKREQREEDETAERAADNCEFAQPRIPRAQPHSPFVHAGCRAGATDLAIVLRRGLMPAQLVLEACLQLQESLETGIRLSSRHAPTWRPLDHRFRPRHG